MAGNPSFPGLIMPTSPPKAKPTVVPLSQGTQGAPPKPATGNAHFPGLILPEAKPPGDGDYVSVRQDDSPGDGTWSTFFHDVMHSQPANLDRPQTWRDWFTKTYNPSAKQVGSAALDDVSFGGADWAQSKLTGENVADIRARTADAQAALGPLGPVINAATYLAPGLGESKLAFAVPGKLLSKAATKLAPTIGRYGAAAAEGGAASGLSSAVHQGGADTFDVDKVIKDTAKGVALGTVAQGFGDVTAPAVQRVADYVSGKPGRGSEQWDWRNRAAAGDPTLADDVALHRAVLPEDHPAQPGLAKVQGALAQSTEPGAVAHASTGVGGFGVNYALGGTDNAAANWLSALGPPAISKYLVNPPARAVNQFDRNINVGQSLDQLYPALYPKQGLSTTNVSGWADSLRGLAVGGERPNGGNAQWW